MLSYLGVFFIEVQNVKIDVSDHVANASVWSIIPENYDVEEKVRAPY